MSTKLRHKLIDGACVLVIVAVVAVAICAALKQCGKTAKVELASAYRYVGNVIW